MTSAVSGWAFVADVLPTAANASAISFHACPSWAFFDFWYRHFVSRANLRSTIDRPRELGLRAYRCCVRLTMSRVSMVHVSSGFMIHDSISLLR